MEHTLVLRLVAITYLALCINSRIWLLSKFHKLSKNLYIFILAKSPQQLVNNMEMRARANIPMVDIGGIQDNNREETLKLFNAAKHNGIFYLDLHDQRFGSILDAVDEIFNISKDLFSLSEEEKLRYDVDKISELKVNG
jgi:hypothetical protein